MIRFIAALSMVVLAGSVTASAATLHGYGPHVASESGLARPVTDDTPIPLACGKPQLRTHLAKKVCG